MGGTSPRVRTGRHVGTSVGVRVGVCNRSASGASASSALTSNHSSQDRQRLGEGCLDIDSD